jgi:RND family efflux transporter MFP subunit
VKIWQLIMLALLFGALGAALTYVFTASPWRGHLALAPYRGQTGVKFAERDAGGILGPNALAAGVYPLIVTSKAAFHSFVQQVPWVGIVQSRASVQLSAFVAGRVEAVEVKDQTAVQAGTVVMRLGGARIATQRAQMQANIDSFKSQLALADQRVDRLSQDLKDQLATRDQLTAAQEARLKLQGQLRDAELALRVFDTQLVITGGAEGVFTNRQVSAGQTVEAGQIVGEVIDPNHLRIVASVLRGEIVSRASRPRSEGGTPSARRGQDGRDMGLLRAVLKGKEATVRLSGNQVVRGFVQQVLPQTAETGATEVWIESPEIDRELKPGQTVSGTVTLRSVASALAVPASAVVYDAQERPYVFIEEKGAYQQRGVTLGLTQDGWVQVPSGIEQGDSVVTQGAYELYYRQFTRQFKVED